MYFLLHLNPHFSLQNLYYSSHSVYWFWAFWSCGSDDAVCLKIWFCCCLWVCFYPSRYERGQFFTDWSLEIIISKIKYESNIPNPFISYYYKNKSFLSLVNSNKVFLHAKNSILHILIHSFLMNIKIGLSCSRLWWIKSYGFEFRCYVPTAVTIYLRLLVVFLCYKTVLSDR